MENIDFWIWERNGWEIGDQYDNGSNIFLLHTLDCGEGFLSLIVTDRDPIEIISGDDIIMGMQWISNEWIPIEGVPPITESIPDILVGEYEYHSDNLVLGIKDKIIYPPELEDAPEWVIPFMIDHSMRSIDMILYLLYTDEVPDYIKRAYKNETIIEKGSSIFIDLDNNSIHTTIKRKIHKSYTLWIKGGIILYCHEDLSMIGKSENSI